MQNQPVNSVNYFRCNWPSVDLLYRYANNFVLVHYTHNAYILWLILIAWNIKQLIHINFRFNYNIINHLSIWKGRKKIEKLRKNWYFYASVASVDLLSFSFNWLSGISTEKGWLIESGPINIYLFSFWVEFWAKPN